MRFSFFFLSSLSSASSRRAGHGSYARGMAAQVLYRWWAMWQNLLLRRRGDFGMLQKIMALFIMALGVSILMATPAVMRRLNRVKK
jgi:hypothetical protein